LLDNLDVRHVVVSFPIQSLAGRSKNMPEFYDRDFRRMTDGYDWRLTKVPIEGELVFVVDKGEEKSAACEVSQGKT
jgi:16S rRNA (guanine(1405)-N(7))-methyltransferase